MTWAKNTEVGSSYITEKKINVLGDSIVNGTTFGASWRTFLADGYGCTVRNYGINGSTVSDRGDGNSMYNRYPSMDNDADIVMVWGGWNDVNQGRPLGTFGSTDPTTFYGALNMMYGGLQSKYIGKKVIACTMLSTREHSWNSVKSYNNAIREVSEYYALPLLELSRVGFSARNDDVAAALIPDFVHPNEAANRIIAEVVAKFINSH